MSLITDLVHYLNEGLIKPAIKTENKKLYGLSQLARFKDKTQPVVYHPMKANEVIYAGIDDKADFILYHRIQNVSSGLSSRSGYGDQLADKTTTYQNFMIVYNNSLKTGLSGSDLYLLIQSLLPYVIRHKDLKKIALVTTGGVLNSATVYAQEYPDATGYTLAPGKELIQINYTLEATFNPACFATCSDDLKLLKN